MLALPRHRRTKERLFARATHGRGAAAAARPACVRNSRRRRRRPREPAVRCGTTRARTIRPSASRSVPELWPDAGHSTPARLYYLLMHGCFTLVPPTEFWSRFPVWAAVESRAAGVVVFAKTVFSRRDHRVCAQRVRLLPRVHVAGVERAAIVHRGLRGWLTVLAWLSRYTAKPAVAVLLYALALTVSIRRNIYLVLLGCQRVITPCSGAVIRAALVGCSYVSGAVGAIRV